MFELAVALKYLLPRRRQLSVSIIALLSVLVIALVVWLLLVFLSVTRGIETRWMQTLVALNAPLRLTPTETYYDSYYYQVDRYSLAAGYTERTIGEKFSALEQDAYDPTIDPELPLNFPEPDRTSDGSLIDPVKSAFGAIGTLEGFNGLRSHEFEVAMGNLRLRRLRPGNDGTFEQSFTNQASYLGSFDGGSRALSSTLLLPTAEDLTHQLALLGLSGENVRQEMPHHDLYLNQQARRDRLRHFMAHLTIDGLITQRRWILPSDLYPTSGTVRAVFLDGQLRLDPAGDVLVDFAIPPKIPLILAPGTTMTAELIKESLDTALEPDALEFSVSFNVQGVSFQGIAPYRGLGVDTFTACTAFTTLPEAPPCWRHELEGTQVLPSDTDWGEGILLAKIFRDQGTLLGDRGYLSYYAATPSGLSEQRLPVFVAGFYDPGPLPTGSRYVLVNPPVTAAVRASVNQVEAGQANGIHVWIDDLGRVDEAKAQLLTQLEAAGIAPYWKVETFKEYEFARPLVEQFQSDRNILALIAIIVIAVACSNIISMLIVLVNDKRREIGIFRSMGATGASIATIFALCGVVMGVAGSLLGIGAAFLTLLNLNHLIALLGKVQGHTAFQATFYGTSLPSELDSHVLAFVIVATAGVSLLAGLIPAVKAACLRPATILRGE